MLQKVPGLYNSLSEQYSFLSGRYAKPKTLLLSRLLSWAGLTGFYFPFTGEANINSDIPILCLPFTACHEAAHQRGIAREEEANFIAYLACMRSEDPIFRYSGVFQALIYCMNALYEQNIDAWRRLNALYSPLTRKDMAVYDIYWQKYTGSIEQLSESVNNAYLKANHQNSGIKSYGQIVELLIAYYHKLFKPE